MVLLALVCSCYWVQHGAAHLYAFTGLSNTYWCLGCINCERVDRSCLGWSVPATEKLILDIGGEKHYKHFSNTSVKHIRQNTCRNVSRSTSGEWSCSRAKRRCPQEMSQLVTVHTVYLFIIVYRCLQILHLTHGSRLRSATCLLLVRDASQEVVSFTRNSSELVGTLRARALSRRSASTSQLF